MIVYRKIILFILAFLILSIVTIGIVQDKTLTRYYSLYNPAETIDVLSHAREFISRSYQNKHLSRKSKDNIIRISESINNSMLHLEEIIILRRELKFYLILSNILIPLIILIAALITIIYLIRNLLKPMRLLTAATKKYADGNSSSFPLPVYGSPDSRLLLSTTNTMIDTLNKQKEIISFQAKNIGWRNAAREIVHEVKNIITPARLYAESAMEILLTIDDKDLKTSLKNILESLDLMQGLTGTLRELYSMRVPEFTRVDLYQIANKAVEFYAKEFPGISLNGVSLSVTADSGLVRSQLDNLIVNSIDALRDRVNGRIVVTAGKDKHPYLECADNGPGINESIRNKIFRINFTTKENGSGFGLYFVNKVCNDHGSRVEILPGLDGAGVTVRIIFDE